MTDWSRKWPFVKVVTGEPSKVFCVTCSRLASKVGVTDVVRHIDSKMHQNNAKSARSQTALTFTRPSSSLKRYCNELTIFHILML